MKKPRVETSVEVLAHIDGSQPVRVYRNLHKDCFSVKQGGLVRCHADSVTLQNVKFIVSKAGQRRVRDEKKKNVHAFVEGYVADTRKADKYVDGEWSDEEIENGFSNWMCAYYNPYECDGFMNTATEQVYETAKFADLSNTDKVIYVFAPLTSDEIRQFKYLSPECMV
tara:strand:- start:28 stop:531 length:504 start_codon:yes stop_codon:yes gene_type:complete